MPIVAVARGPINVHVSGEGPPLVLLHANPGDSRDFDAVRPALEKRYRVMALDWPGYGESPAPHPPQAASAMGFAEVLRQLVEALNLEPAIYVGNSVGGYAAAALAIAEPARVRALVLVSPGGFTGSTVLTRAFCRFKGREWVTRMSKGLLPRMYLRRKTPLVREMIERSVASSRDAVAVNAAVWRSFLHPDHDLRAAARSITAPTLVISGRLDPIIRAESDGRTAATLIPGARQVILETGHAPFAEDPAAFMAALEPFLRSLE